MRRLVQVECQRHGKRHVHLCAQRSGRRRGVDGPKSNSLSRASSAALARRRFTRTCRSLRRSKRQVGRDVQLGGRGRNLLRRKRIHHRRHRRGELSRKPHRRQLGDNRRRAGALDLGADAERLRRIGLRRTSRLESQAATKAAGDAEALPVTVCGRRALLRQRWASHTSSTAQRFSSRTTRRPSATPASTSSGRLMMRANAPPAAAAIAE